MQHPVSATNFLIFFHQPLDAHSPHFTHLSSSSVSSRSLSVTLSLNPETFGEWLRFIGGIWPNFPTLPTTFPFDAFNEGDFLGLSGSYLVEWLGYNLVKFAWWSTQSFGHSTSTWQTHRQPRRHCKCRANVLRRAEKIRMYVFQILARVVIGSNVFLQGRKEVLLLALYQWEIFWIMIFLLLTFYKHTYSTIWGITIKYVWTEL